ncbi:MAG: LacI family DNA-binding transcriptional regulator [Propionicimonas sp.]
MGEPGSRPTIYDVARVAGVSKSLVSLVLQGSQQVSSERRRAVVEAIEQLGYRPSRAAATLAGSRSRSVGVVIDDYSNLWFVGLLKGLRTVLDPLGYTVLVSDRHQAGPLRQDAVNSFLASQVDGVVIAAELGVEGEALPVPAVVAGTRLHSVAGADRIATDNALGVRLAVTHLVELGHRRIGHVTGVGGSARGRRNAYLAMMRELNEPARMAGLGELTNEAGGYRGAVKLLERYPEITALLAANDTMALGALAALREAGRSVPHDVSLVGYDNSPLAKARFLALTTVDVHNARVGRACAQALLRRMRDPEASPQVLTLPPTLVVRSSSAPLSPAPLHSPWH